MTTLFVNTTDLMPPSWRFLEPVWTDARAQWEVFHGVPQNRLEQAVKRPHLARYRAAFQGVRHARRHQPRSILVSHLPAMTAATNMMRRRFCPDVRHIAFAFNFTDLPTGRRLSYFRHALAGIEAFVVFSNAERDLYSRSFGIPEEKFHMLHWAMEAPEAGPDNPVAFQRPYLCAVGGEGRDYAALLDAMRQLPDLRLAIVARPYSIAGLDIPENVQVFTNLPSPQTWRLAQDSLGMVIPLKSGQTACGHITIAGAQLLGIPLAVTRSSGVLDYVSDETAFMTRPGDISDIRQALRTLSQQQDIVRQKQRCAQKRARARSGLQAWVRYFETLLD